MEGRIRNYYADGNTCIGFYNFFESNLQGLNYIFLLNGGGDRERSSFIKKTASNWIDKGYDIEIIHCSSDNEIIDGFIIQNLKIGIINSTGPHNIEFDIPGADINLVDLNDAVDIERLDMQMNEINSIYKKMDEAYDKAYNLFGAAHGIHDEWEKIYIENLNRNNANIVTEELKERIFEDKILDKKAVVKHRFFGAATPKGAVDFIQNLTQDISKRYFIKGRPGTGKSTMLKKLATEGESRGFDIEVYHCGFDPNSLDMITVRELDIVIFDSTSPHEYYPSRNNDEIVDMYERTITPGTDEKYEEELNDIVKRYKANMAEATEYLSKAKAMRDEVNAIYSEITDDEKIENIFNSINCKMEEIAKG